MNKNIDQNVVRRGVALSIPVILDCLAHGCKQGELDAIKHFLPKYKLTGLHGNDIQPYFTPVRLKDTGKRRVYMNGNGYFIRYLTRKSVRAILDDVRATQNSSVTETVFNDCFANRWVVIKGNGYRSLDSFEDFINSIIFIESVASKMNHPPCGYAKFTCIADMLDHGGIRDFGIDIMQPGARSISVKLEKYELSLPKINEVKSS